MAALTAQAELVTREAPTSVINTMDALETAVTDAGASVVARVNHGMAAKGVGLEMNDAELLIFGNPKLGTQAMQADPRAGLFLPMKVLVYADAEGKTHIVYEDPTSMLSKTDVPADAEFLKTMTGALDKFSTAAAGG
ncbi:DUF302 domain-containing protein [Actibacterium sp. 188UL27-1]|nr:DUF302 domain-containing protein [Actibacterium sp. 188UL27-1]MBM7069252.1 DUF302 domain-containing protein [Actibacterium sp. 188UL27-1]